MMNAQEEKVLKTALDLAIEANASLQALYVLVGQTVTIDHDKLMELRNENVEKMRKDISQIINS